MLKKTFWRAVPCLLGCFLTPGAGLAERPAERAQAQTQAQTQADDARIRRSACDAALAAVFKFSLVSDQDPFSLLRALWSDRKTLPEPGTVLFERLILAVKPDRNMDSRVLDLPRALVATFRRTYLLDSPEKFPSNHETVVAWTTRASRLWTDEAQIFNVADPNYRSLYRAYMGQGWALALLPASLVSELDDRWGLQHQVRLARDRSGEASLVSDPIQKIQSLWSKGQLPEKGTALYTWLLNAVGRSDDALAQISRSCIIAFREAVGGVIQSRILPEQEGWVRVVKETWRTKKELPPSISPEYMNFYVAFARHARVLGVLPRSLLDHVERRWRVGEAPPGPETVADDVTSEPLLPSNWEFEEFVERATPWVLRAAADLTLSPSRRRTLLEKAGLEALSRIWETAKSKSVRLREAFTNDELRDVMLHVPLDRWGAVDAAEGDPDKLDFNELLNVYRFDLNRWTGNIRWELGSRFGMDLEFDDVFDAAVVAFYEVVRRNVELHGNRTRTKLSVMRTRIRHRVIRYFASKRELTRRHYAVSASGLESTDSLPLAPDTETDGPDAALQFDSQYDFVMTHVFPYLKPDRLDAFMLSAMGGFIAGDIGRFLGVTPQRVGQLIAWAEKDIAKLLKYYRNHPGTEPVGFDRTKNRFLSIERVLERVPSTPDWIGFQAAVAEFVRREGRFPDIREQRLNFPIWDSMERQEVLRDARLFVAVTALLVSEGGMSVEDERLLWSVYLAGDRSRANGRLEELNTLLLEKTKGWMSAEACDQDPRGCDREFIRMVEQLRDNAENQ